MIQLNVCASTVMNSINFKHVPHLVNLCNHSIHHLSFERPEHNGLVLDRVQDKPSAWLDYTCPNVVNGGDCNDKAISERELLL